MADREEERRKSLILFHSRYGRDENEGIKGKGEAKKIKKNQRMNSSVSKPKNGNVGIPCERTEGREGKSCKARKRKEKQESKTNQLHNHNTKKVLIGIII